MMQGLERYRTGGNDMSQKAEFHNLHKPDDGLFRDLTEGVTTRSSPASRPCCRW
jgi:hypothetical protein